MPPLAKKENERLEKLYSLNILDTKPENEYDRITGFARRRFDVPIALISLVDKDRQWFKSKSGIDIPQTSRDASICSEMIEQNMGTHVIHDTFSDDKIRRISTHPTFIKPLRFYASAPLITKDNHTLGSFCIIDMDPRHHFTQGDINDMEFMADVIMKFIEGDKPKDPPR